MGNAAGSLKKHLETAEKTGALNFTERGIDKFPPELAKVWNSCVEVKYSNLSTSIIWLFCNLKQKALFLESLFKNFF